MRRYSILVFTFLNILTFTACSDFFDTDPKNIVSEDDYIAKEDEMYKGMLGILTRVQVAGDHSIWLTDTRASFLQVTENAPDALKDIYNYEPTSGNEYADPSCYYDIIIACNDYIDRMGTFHHNTSGMGDYGEAHFQAMLSSTLRIKAWAYYMLGRIYGQAYWFDSPVTDAYDLSDTSVFTLCDMQQLVERCIALLDNGITVDGIHIPADVEMQWHQWLDPESPQSEATYQYWRYFTPPHLLLRAELVSWRCCYLSEEAAQTEWLWIRDTLLKYLDDIHNGVIEVPYIDGSEGTTDAPGHVYQCNIPLQSDAGQAYFNIFCMDDEVNQHYQVVSAIKYNYENHQRNRLVQYLCPAYPSADAFYLEPSEYGMNQYDETDIRSLTQRMVLNNINGRPAVSKFYYFYDFNDRTYKYLKTNLFEIEPMIVTFRGHDFHFLLAEAENHLGNWRQAYAILNTGLDNEFVNKTLPDDGSWSPYYASWMAPRGGYGNAGIVGCVRGTVHQLPRPGDADFDQYTPQQLKAMYDWALADEHLKEYVCEGKSYSYLCKMAERYSNGGRGTSADARQQVADRIAPKYTTATMRGRVASAIAQQGYFIGWDLK